MRTFLFTVMTLVIVAPALLALSPAGAITVAPPNGKYLDVRNGSIYMYDAASGTLTLTSDSVGPRTCYGGFQETSQCGQCDFLPPGAAWEVDATYSAGVGSCLSVHAIWGTTGTTANFRADARVIDSVAWQYEVRVIGGPCGLDCHPSQSIRIYPAVDCLSATIPNTNAVVSFCGQGTVGYSDTFYVPPTSVGVGAWSAIWTTGAHLGWGEQPSSDYVRACSRGYPPAASGNCEWSSH